LPLSSSAENASHCPEWPDKTIAVLSTENGEVHAIPITAPLRVGDRRILFRLKRCRESLARLREHPKVALTIFGKGNLAFTARGPAHVVQDPMVLAPAFAAVAIDVENIDDHRQREFAVDSGVSLDWTNERTQRFLQEHLNALREVAAGGEKCLSVEAGHVPRCSFGDSRRLHLNKTPPCFQRRTLRKSRAVHSAQSIQKNISRFLKCRSSNA